MPYLCRIVYAHIFTVLRVQEQRARRNINQHKQKTWFSWTVILFLLLLTTVVVVVIFEVRVQCTVRLMLRIMAKVAECKTAHHGFGMRMLRKMNEIRAITGETTFLTDLIAI